MSGNSPTAREGRDAGSRLAWSLPVLLSLALFAKIVSAPPTRAKPAPGRRRRPASGSGGFARSWNPAVSVATPNWRRETCAWIPALPSSPGGKSGPAVPGDAASSLLLQVIGYQHEIKRPPDRALPPDYVAQIARWIAEGLVWPEAEGPLLQPSVISEAHRLHWAFQPLAAAPAPEPVSRYPEANATDRFLLARLEAEGRARRPWPAGGP